MRLIDADELKEVIYRSSVDTREKIKNIIDNAPTVDIKPFASFSFDKDELNRIVEERVIEPIKNGELVVKTEERPQGEIIKELWNCRNELCLKCERYKEAYRGACEDCRYNFANMEKWKEGSDEVADDKHL